MDSFEREGLRFNVVDGGSEGGIPVVLLHGFPQDATIWDEVSPLLHSGGMRTLAPHQRGYSVGARPQGRSAYHVRELALDVVALLDAAGLQRAHVVGHDWGGLVAWAVGAWYPDRVTTLTVLSVPHPRLFFNIPLLSKQALRTFYVRVMKLPVLPEKLMLAADGAGIRNGMTRDGVPRESADRYVRRLQQPGALTAAMNWYRAIPLSSDDPVGEVRVPTLHVWSTGDLAIGRGITEATRQFVTGPYRLEVLEGVTHWIPDIAPAQTAELILEHSRSH